MTPSAQNPPPVSVVICTKDHPAELRRCLASLQPIRKQALEIIVVDNNSATQETRLVAQEFEAIYVREETPGLSAARNRSIAVARGEALAFTDDDCEVDPGWIRGIQTGFSDPRVGCVTGKATAPRGAAWVQQQFQQLARGFEVDHIVQITREQLGNHYVVAGWGVGANMAFRAEALLAAGGFPLVLTDTGDDKYMFFIVVDAGWVLQYRPDCVVYQTHRKTMAAQLKRHFEYGLSIPLWFAITAAKQGNRRGYRDNLLFYCPRATVNALRRLARGKLVQVLFAAAELVGVVAGLLRRNVRTTAVPRADSAALP